MKITKKLIIDEYGSPDRLKILVDGTEKFSIGSGEPEDMSLSRDLNDCLRIPNLMQLAYEAGKNGESFEIETLKYEYED